MKLCKDCKWVVVVDNYPLCNHPNVPHSVYNSVADHPVFVVRGEGNICGIEAKLFEEKFI